ncbi:hypothetical protein JYG23_04005 [Sedimentibacter sp. zth1]|uniref:hypothetical protein n=1 Tax=Sedimentibacter sp. zth1 TaxID=2816908 RepID=UPI001A92F11D|nr:hypothetical protein [Sedimentibacter sp. zth1]QSX06630.1 hypothetical protein JYG23_04005 [Sedimentibacter sp. zth1]
MQNSWSVIKRDLEENLLCDKLKGRVKYIIKSDNKKVVYIKVDGIERNIEALKDKKVIQQQDEQNTIKENGLDSIYMLKAIKEYKRSNFNNSLYSHNPLIRMLAIMDKRVTPKLTEKLTKELKNQPDWLKYFYKLRFDIENIPYEDEKEVELEEAKQEEATVTV